MYFLPARPWWVALVLWQKIYTKWISVEDWLKCERRNWSTEIVYYDIYYVLSNLANLWTFQTARMLDWWTFLYHRRWQHQLPVLLEGVLLLWVCKWHQTPTNSVSGLPVIKHIETCNGISLTWHIYDLFVNELIN